MRAETIACASRAYPYLYSVRATAVSTKEKIRLRENQPYTVVGELVVVHERDTSNCTAMMKRQASSYLTSFLLAGCLLLLLVAARQVQGHAKVAEGRAIDYSPSNSLFDSSDEDRHHPHQQSGKPSKFDYDYGQITRTDDSAEHEAEKLQLQDDATAADTTRRRQDDVDRSTASSISSSISSSTTEATTAEQETMEEKKKRSDENAKCNDSDKRFSVKCIKLKIESFVRTASAQDVYNVSESVQIVKKKEAKYLNVYNNNTDSNNNNNSNNSSSVVSGGAAASSSLLDALRRFANSHVLKIKLSDANELAPRMFFGFVAQSRPGWRRRRPAAVRRPELRVQGPGRRRRHGLRRGLHGPPAAGHSPCLGHVRREHAAAADDQVAGGDRLEIRLRRHERPVVLADPGAEVSAGQETRLQGDEMSSPTTTISYKEKVGIPGDPDELADADQLRSVLLAAAVAPRRRLRPARPRDRGLPRVRRLRHVSQPGALRALLQSRLGPAVARAQRAAQAQRRQSRRAALLPLHEGRQGRPGRGGLRGRLRRLRRGQGRPDDKAESGDAGHLSGYRQARARAKALVAFIFHRDDDAPLYVKEQNLARIGQFIDVNAFLHTHYTCTRSCAKGFAYARYFINSIDIHTCVAARIPRAHVGFGMNLLRRRRRRGSSSRSVRDRSVESGTSPRRRRGTQSLPQGSRRGRGQLLLRGSSHNLRSPPDSESRRQGPVRLVRPRRRPDHGPLHGQVEQGLPERRLRRVLQVPRAQHLRRFLRGAELRAHGEREGGEDAEERHQRGRKTALRVLDRAQV
ncbi:unnamed protein product [Trichogramma brassicae]|uniref:Uncharacterized protein n=1 Tax=Trichogramma brassicae TaxID=86971 RepID=A0A6H5I6G5_9HYME|nr:unnamed protein product [Trichogramma brassicae]